MFRKKPSEKAILNVLSFVIILVTGLLEYHSPPGVFLAWGYMAGVFLTIHSGEQRVIILATTLSLSLLLFSFLHAGKEGVHDALVLNRGYAALGIAFSGYLVMRIVSREKSAENIRTQMEGIFSHGTQGIVVMDEEGTISLVNPFIEKMFGYSSTELIGKNIRVLTPELAIAQHVATENRVIGRPPNDLPARRKDGSPFLVDISLNRYPSGNIFYVVAFINDVTARKQNEEKLYAKKQELEAVNKELEAFSYSVSHDLRAPLRAVGGYAKMLEEDYSPILDAEGKRLLSIIGSSAEQMGTLIDDLLAFSRLGKKEIRMTEVDMRALVHNTLFEIGKAVKHQAEIVVGDLHPAMADTPLIAQVLTNLISNAIKYSSKVENPKIKIDSLQEDGVVTYAISDNGAGFDMEFADKLFGVFQRLHSSDDFEGTGVGLAIARRIIEKHRGKIWAQAKVAEGATFFFTLSSVSKARNPNSSCVLTTQNENQK